MTSINLVSPVGNGHTYSVRFREPIVIHPNSKVYLNFAKFKRNSSIYFTTDQTIEVVLGDVLPTVIPNDTATSNSVMAVNTITIPSINPLTNKTGYTPEDLTTVIANRLGGDPEIDDDYGIRVKDGLPKQMFLYNSIFDKQNTSDLSIGFYKDYNEENSGASKAITLSAEHNIGMAFDGDSLVKTSADFGAGIYYDCFAMSKETYDFSYQSNLDMNSNHNLITFKAKKTVGEQVGKVFLGLSSLEIAEAVRSGAGDWTDYDNAGTNNKFTQGTSGTQTSKSGRTLLNPILYQPNVTDAIINNAGAASLITAIPQAFMGVEITGDATRLLNIWRGIDFLDLAARGGRPKKPSDELNRMELMYSVSVDTLIGGVTGNNVQLQIAIQTYWADGFNANSTNKLGFRIFNFTNSHIASGDNLIYDTKNGTKWLDYEFFRQNGLTDFTAGTAAQKAQKVNSQIPFNIITSAQKVGEGFENIKMAGFEKIGANSPLSGAASNDSPITFVQNYQLKMSTELAKYVGVSTSPSYNPNRPENEVESVVKEDDATHTDESYSIFLKNLSISAYKNIQSKAMSAGANIQSAGYSQPILADVPTPYSDSKVINNGNGDVVVGTFQPSIVKKLDLNNNKQVLNSIDVEIRDIETNEISEGLSGSVINFTIEKSI